MLQKSSMPLRLIAAAILSVCGVAVAQDRIMITESPKSLTIGSKKIATSLPSEKATYLGIATSPVSPATREQLKLQRGIGVVVERVEKDSPAEQAGVKRYDIVEKYGDQLLVDGKQLAILVRLNEPGTTVPLTVIRQGQRQQIAVTLSEKMMPVAAETTISIGSSADHLIESGSMTIVGEPRADSPPDINNILRELKTTQSVVNIVDGEVYNFRKENGSTTLRISDKNKTELFEGPLNSEEDLKAVPPEYQEKVRAMTGKAKSLLGTR